MATSDAATALMSAAQMACVDYFERYAQRTLNSSTLGYIQGGADDELTLKDNVLAFRRYQIVPRVLRSTSECSTETTVLGHRIAFPVCVAPTAYMCMAHPDGEIATARAAASVSTGLALSTLSTSSLEQVALEACSSDAAAACVQFFQLYMSRDRDVAERLVARAERSGYAAIFLTVDVQVFGKRRAQFYNPTSLSPHLQLPNVESASAERRLVGMVNEYVDPYLSWDTVTWLKSITKLPVVVKGILAADDALEAVRRGVSAVVVSNHGGRQLDSVPAALDALTDVVRAVAGRCEIYMDGGVRTGTDVFKALALGARAVFVGRPAVYGLAYNGEAGVRQVLSILRDEFRNTMLLAGCSTVNDINESFIRRPSHFSTDLSPASRL